MNIKHVTWGTWQKVCTTSVADTSGTATISNNATGNVRYIVRNGICYVEIQNLANELNGKKVCSVTGLPKPAIFLDSVLEVDGAPVGSIYTFDGVTLYVHKISNRPGFCSFSYPVAVE